MIREIFENELEKWQTILQTIYIDAYGTQDRGRSIAYDVLLGEYKNGHMFFVSQEDDKIVGVLRLMRRDDYYIIKDIAVLLEYQRKGYGEGLIEFAKKKTKELGASKVSLGFFDDNISLRNWYEKHGFNSVTTFPFNNSPDPHQIIRVMECVV